ncbi:hypothetical protein GIS00_18505 [Nakamurella sp. YIM 132087]|uniref:Uncharacterized protein n=1 Tax=Nakamurella alba TaxID=2665158 RepID=A0A7K1FPB7_9ACTN|nr:hypothetical protein [Nakamurella alba]MTD15930.1 hypothetical protein [Nakamurella alba]
MNRSRSTAWSRLTALAIGVVAVLSVTGVASGTGESPAGGPPSPSALAAAPPPASRQPVAEASYVAITPCRIVDTRLGTGTGGTPFASTNVRTYYVGGTTGFAPQGGKTGGCGIPVGATSIAAVVTAVDPSAPGYVRAWPNGIAEPNASLLNYATASNGTGGNVAINASSAYALKIRNYGGPTDIVIDVNGYYVKPMAGMISDAGTPYSGSSRITAGVRVSQGVYDVTFDREVQYCSAVASVYYENYYVITDTYFGSSNKVRVKVYDAAANLQDAYFYITVNC